MGSSPPPAPTVVTTQPTTYRSFFPLQAYQGLGEYSGRIAKETEAATSRLYAQGGSPFKVGATQAETNLKAAATYLSSLPGRNAYLESITGQLDPFAPAREAAGSSYSKAQQEYATAMQNINNKPAQTQFEMPSWATAPVAAESAAVASSTPIASTDDKKQDQDQNEQSMFYPSIVGRYGTNSKVTPG